MIDHALGRDNINLIEQFKAKRTNKTQKRISSLWSECYFVFTVPRLRSRRWPTCVPSRWLSWTRRSRRTSVWRKLKKEQQKRWKNEKFHKKVITITSTAGVHQMRLLHRHWLHHWLWYQLMIFTLKMGHIRRPKITRTDGWTRPLIEMLSRI